LSTLLHHRMVDDVNDVRIVGAITVVILLCITFAGMAWEAKAQILFFIAIMLSLINYFVGTVIPTNREKESVGFFGYRGDIFVENLLPSYRGPNGYFFRLFAIFFPAATGILSGVNICGDLKDPTGGIPKGTLLAILWTTLSYLLISVTCAATVVRDASGNVNDSLALTNFTTHCTGLGCKLGWNFDRCEQNRTCRHGLANNLRILTTVSGWGILITIGVFAATLSSALGFLVSAPKIFQCLCKDNIYPYIGFFGKGYGKNNEPLRGYSLMFCIAMAFILIGDLNTIAPLISNFFLCSYGLINFSTFHASVTQSPGWRPEYHYYSPWTSLFGSFLSFILMFLFTWWAALVTFFIVLFLLGYVTYTKPSECHALPVKQQNPKSSFLLASGLGKLKPNTLVLGYKMNWQECKPESLQDYINTISNAFDSSYGIAILRMMDGLDIVFPFELNLVPFDLGPYKTFLIPHPDISDDGSNEQVRSVFQTKQGRKSIDIYWISDDGGLTLLVPYLLTRRNRWKKCKLRVFILGDQETIKEDRKDEKVRNGHKHAHEHAYKNIHVYSNCCAFLPLCCCSLQRYEETIAPFRLSEEQAGGDIQELKRLSPWKISNKDLEAIQPKVCLMCVCVCFSSLPVPDVTCPSSLYMSWMDALSYGIHCPVLLIRGNQENVMTFYCQ
uniref:Solute carrier family 12 member 3-like n=1 Tax=Sinocyclocheilus anshuiensis TaxID=1608454 RepID=A0A671QTB7_9TELE